MKERVYEFLLTVPRGKVVTYGQIAAYLGDPKLAGAVGNALHQNPDGDKYPCYKVVDRNGRLSEHYAFGGIEEQRRRLETEGILVKNDKVSLEKYGLGR